MGFFNGLFSENSESTNNIHWIKLTEVEQLASLITQSNKKPVLIFKHSTRCGISRMALKSFEREYDLDEATIALYFLDLLKYREISNEIAEKFNIYHQSPQVLVIKDEKVSYHDSHYSVSISEIKKVIEK